MPEDERPIIILQADEGPWSGRATGDRKSTFDWADASDDELEIKFGILNAWYVPGGEDLGLYPTMTSINTFPLLFNRYFGLDYPLLPDRVFAPEALLPQLRHHGRHRPAAEPAMTAATKRPRFVGMHPVLFAAYAVLFLWSQNLGETDPRQVLSRSLGIVLGAALVTIVLGLLFRDRRRGALVATPLVVGLLMYGHAAHLVASSTCRVRPAGRLGRRSWSSPSIAAVRLDERRIATIDGR